MKPITLSSITLAAALLAGCSDSHDILSPDTTPAGKQIIAEAAAPAADSRSAIDGSPDGTAVVGILWTPGDELGVFGPDGSQHRYVKSDQSASEARAAFSPAGSAPAEPRYAYYPYSAGNDGLAPSALKGTVPSEQPMDDGSIAGDYKYGTPVDGDASRFEFRNLFSLIKVDIDAAATVLEGDVIKKVEVSTSRDGQPVAIAGDFNFSATTGSISYAASAGNTIAMTWQDGPALGSESLTGYISLFPNVRAGDTFSLTVTTDSHIARFAVASKLTFRGENIYHFGLDISRFATEEYSFAVTDPEGNPITDPTTPAEPITGTFTAATLNVNGLRTGSGGATAVGQRLQDDGFDIISVSEDFQHSNLVQGLTNYYCGEAPGNSFSRTDGIVLFWKKEGFTATGETRVKYDSSYGGITDGADTTKDKGFRYYLLTLADGTEIDVYITHMNSGSSEGHLSARKDQLKQLAEYILSHNNGRPIIFMGDTNCRYTRDYVKALLIDPLAEAGIVGHDPWVDFQWDGQWPNCPSNSIMVSASTGAATIDGVSYPDDDNNGQGYGFQKGEVVDKIIYFNVPNAKTTLTATTYLHDGSYGDLSDHYPVTTTFQYTTTR